MDQTVRAQHVPVKPQLQRAPAANSVSMADLEAMFQRLLEMDRDSDEFTAVFEACHTMIGRALVDSVRSC